MAFSIRLSEEERQLADSYAKLHSMSMGEAFKRALFDKIEEDYDITAAEEAYGEYQRSGKKSRPVGEFWTSPAAACCFRQTARAGAGGSPAAVHPAHARPGRCCPDNDYTWSSPSRSSAASSASDASRASFMARSILRRRFSAR